VGGRILLIEDEGNILEAITFILSRAGWDVQGHGNGATAFDAVRRIIPDIVVLDVMLPGRSGLDILRDLRADPRTEHLPVLMLTARGQARDRDTALELGASAYLTKPFSNADLVATIEQLAAGALDRARGAG
jgi:DNA-binding response OmpR family regulator